MDVLVQQNLVNSSTNNYAYKALMETLLSYDTNAKGTRLQAEGFYKDTAGVMDEPDPVSGGNWGLGQCFNLTFNSKVADFIGPLHADFFQKNRMLLNAWKCKSDCGQPALPLPS